MAGQQYVNIIPNKIKLDYTTQGFPNTFHYDSDYLNINTWYFGIDVNRPYGPSSGTGWYQGIDARTIDDAVYTIYYTGTTIGNTGNANDKYRCVQYDNQLDVINFVNSVTAGFPTFTTFEDALNWFKDDGYTKGGQGYHVCTNMNYPNIPTSGLTFGVDAGHVASYPWINPTWYDFGLLTMSGFSGNSRIIGHFDNNSLFFNFSDAGAQFEYFTSPKAENLGQEFTIIFWGAPTNVSDTNIHSVFSADISTFVSYVGIYDEKSTGVKFYFRVYDTTNTSKSRVGVTQNANSTWAQFTYVFKTNSGGTTTSQFYYNDTLQEENVETYLIKSWQTVGSNNSWSIGQIARTPSLSNNYYGGMAVVLVYNRALSGTEIADIYNNYFDSRLLFQ
jgi:hypothetical protein